MKEVLVQNNPEQPSALDVEPHSSTPSVSESWPWWWSTDEERYHGPCDSRADAIMEAWADTAGEASVAFICQATQEGALCTDIFDGWRLAELFDDSNEESSDPDGDTLSADVAAAEWDALAKRLNALVKGFVRDHGLKSWAFRNQTKLEEVGLTQAALVTLPWHTRRAVDELIQTLADPFGQRPEHLDGLLAQIRRAALLGDGDAKLSPLAAREDEEPSEPKDPSHPLPSPAGGES